MAHRPAFSADQRLVAKSPARPQASPHAQVPVTLLKPLKGSEATTESCLRSWFAQDYSRAGPTSLCRRLG